MRHGPDEATLGADIGRDQRFAGSKLLSRLFDGQRFGVDQLCVVGKTAFDLLGQGGAPVAQFFDTFAHFCNRAGVLLRRVGCHGIGNEIEERRNLTP